MRRLRWAFFPWLVAACCGLLLALDPGAQTWGAVRVTVYAFMALIVLWAVWYAWPREHRA